jgi:hypothetical protein
MNVFSKDDNRRDKVKEGIKFLLSHFEGRQRLFPRKMSTALTKGKQFTVYDKGQILNECIKAAFIDCRLNGYPILDKDIGVEDYSHANRDHLKCKSQTSMPIQAPNIIFIDVDIPRETNQQEEEAALLLKNVLKTIDKRLNCCSSPTVLWTGNGYHIYIVLNTRPLELVQELSELSDNPSEEFLRFAETTLTNSKKDSKHNPSFKSCLLRIPYTLNSKNIDVATRDYVKDPEVKTIQEFDSSNIPTIGSLLIRQFRLYLADLDIMIKAKRRRLKTNQQQQLQNSNNSNHHRFPANSIPKSYLWIDNKLLQTAIPDHRKYTLELLLAPYLINIKHLPVGYAYSLIKRWTSKCNALRRLEPSSEYFDNKIRAAINNSLQSGIPPIKKENMQRRYPEWYNGFKEWLILD